MMGDGGGSDEGGEVAVVGLVEWCEEGNVALGLYGVDACDCSEDDDGGRVGVGGFI